MLYKSPIEPTSALMTVSPGTSEGSTHATAGFFESASSTAAVFATWIEGHSTHLRPVRGSIEPLASLVSSVPAL